MLLVLIAEGRTPPADERRPWLKSCDSDRSAPVDRAETTHENYAMQRKCATNYEFMSTGNRYNAAQLCLNATVLYVS